MATGAVTSSVEPLGEVPRVCRTHCRITGGCYFNGNICVATRDEHCRQSRTCRVNGICNAFKGRCVGRSDEDCQKSERCINEGLCWLRPTVGATNCYAKSEQDCNQSVYCKDKGRCVLDVDHCVSEGMQQGRKAPPPP